jgi:hypothetical protein
MVEEHAFNFPGWLTSIGVSGSFVDMYIMNYAFLVVGVCAAAVGWKSPSFSLCFPALMLVNGLFYIVASIVSWRLNPGLLTVMFIAPIAAWSSTCNHHGLYNWLPGPRLSGTRTAIAVQAKLLNSSSAGEGMHSCEL